MKHHRMTLRQYLEKKTRELTGVEKAGINPILDKTPGVGSGELTQKFNCKPIQIAGIKAARNRH